MKLFQTIEDQYATLSKSQQKIARYVREHSADLLFLSLAELAARIETSPATLVRFAQALGFSGYPDMQRHMQNEALIAREVAGGERVESARTAQSRRATQTLARMYGGLDEVQIGRVADMIMAARHVLIVGYMDAMGVSAELYHRFHCFREGVYFSRLILDWNDMTKLMHSEALMLVVSFAPHYAYALTCVQEARARGSKVLLITDNGLNAFSGLCDEVLHVELQRLWGAHRLGQLDVGPVFGLIQVIIENIYTRYQGRLLDPYRHNERFVD